MVTLAQFMSELSFKELSNLAAGDSGYGAIRPEKVPLVVNCINEALMRLHNRFILKTNNLIIETKEYITEYKLSSEHAVSTPYDAEKYIIDMEKPFRDDLIKILEVYNVQGERIPLNNASNPLSLYTPRPDTLQIPYPTSNSVYSVSYQAKHSPLSPQYLNQPIEIPDNLKGALSSYVAFLIYSSMNGNEATTAAQKFLQQYTFIINDIIETDTANTSISQDSSRFNQNGWC